ncbi:hypothetical protein [uncultured Phascolarctobacterium sp.]|nr:hypothetical protein [uncultured Phascolarctobacterium sp.]
MLEGVKRRASMYDTYEQAAGLAAQQPHLKELATHRHECGEA